MHIFHLHFCICSYIRCQGTSAKILSKKTCFLFSSVLHGLRNLKHFSKYPGLQDHPGQTLCQLQANRRTWIVLVPLRSIRCAPQLFRMVLPALILHFSITNRRCTRTLAWNVAEWWGRKGWATAQTGVAIKSWRRLTMTLGLPAGSPQLQRKVAQPSSRCSQSAVEFMILQRSHATLYRSFIPVIMHSIATRKAIVASRGGSVKILAQLYLS